MYNFEAKFILSKHLYASGKRYYSPALMKRLFSEIKNKCPKCKKPLNWGLDLDDLNSKKNQIAHIYGRKKFKSENLPLSKPYHIEKNNELDKYHNLIVLCDRCHHEYDTNPTHEKYLNILRIKRWLYESHDLENLISIVLDDTLDAIRNNVFNDIFKEELPRYNLRRTNLNDKLKINKINHVKKRDIRFNISEYYLTIENHINEYENQKGFTDEILAEFSKVYTYIKLKFPDKNLLLTEMETAISSSIDPALKDIVKVLIPYMIMKCEVLENVAK